MALLRTGPDALVFDGEVSDRTCDDLEGALDLLRVSDIEVPSVDLSRVSHISSRAVGLLVALWIDMFHQGRWFELQASDRVWDVLGMVGVAGMFLKRPGGQAQVREAR